MFKTALVALDLSPAEGPIVDCLADLRGWGVTRVVLTHVIQVGYAQGAGYGREPDYAAWLERRAEGLRQSGLVVEVQIRTAGVRADEVLAAAAETAADLVVVGSRSHNMVQTLFLGSVARALIRKTRLPLLLQWVEPTAEATEATCAVVCTRTLGHVLLATDFSKHAAAAEATAVTLAARAGRIDCLHVMQPAALDATPALPVMAKAALEAVRTRIREAGGRGEALLAEGEPAGTIARVASERGCTLILLGKHGRNWIESMAIGSTAAAVCETARRPVLMVPLALREQDPTDAAGRM